MTTTPVMLRTQTDRRVAATAPLVYTRAFWWQAWTLAPNLLADQCTWGTSPSFSTAALSYKYGVEMPPGGVAFQNISPTELRNRYVKIVTPRPGDQVYEWIGLVSDQQDDPRGNVPFSVTTVRSGTQHFGAYGLEMLLRRDPIDHAWVFAGAFQPAKRIDVPLVFNDPALSSAGPERPVKNRSKDVSDKGVYVFSSDPSQADWWDEESIADYLVAYHAPVDADGEQRIPFNIYWQSWRAWPDVTDNYERYLRRVVIDPTNRTVADCFDDLSERRYGAAWRIRDVIPNQDQDYINVEFFPLRAQPVDLGHGVWLHPNTRQVVLPVVDSPTTKGLSIRESESHRCTRIKVRGARERVQFTICIDAANMEPDWTDEDKAAYNEAGSTYPGYSGLDLRSQQQANSDIRQGDRLRKVFQKFRLPKDWNGESSGFEDDGTINGDRHDVFDGAEYYLPKLRFLNKLLMPTPGEGIDGEPLPLLAIFRDPHDNDRWKRIDDAATLIELDEGLFGRTWAGRVTPADDGPALWINCHPPHAIADTHWTPIAADDEVDGAINYEHNFLVTVAIETQRHCEYEYVPEDASVRDHERSLTIDVGPQYRLDRVMLDAIVDIQDGQVVKWGQSSPLRDDRDRLSVIARMLFDWHGRRRQAASFTHGTLLEGLMTGDVVTRITGATASYEIGACVTSLTFDFVQQSTSVFLDFAELDATRLYQPPNITKGSS